MSIVTNKIYTCSRCKQIYNPSAVIDGDIRSVFLIADLMWIKNAGTEQEIDASKIGKASNLCNPCADSLLQWYQDNNIGDGD